MKTKSNSTLRKTIELDKVKDLYITKNLQMKEVAAIIGCSTATLSRFLRENNIKKERREISSSNIELKNQILHYINEGNSPTKTCKMLHITNLSYHKIMGDEFVSKMKWTKNEINEDFIDFSNPAFCYILGMFISDGHMDSNTIYICQSNASYLKKLQGIMGHTGTLKKVSKIDVPNTCYSLVILSPKLRKILTDYDVQSNKKLNAPYIDCGINEAHFIRGLFDGDGCLYYSYVSGKLKNRRVSISTASPFVRDGVALFMQKHSLNYSIVQEKAINICYDIIIDEIDDIIKFLEIIYNDKQNAFLDRKYVEFIKFKELIDMNRKVNDIVDSTGKLVV